jgi:Fic family protein
MAFIRKKSKGNTYYYELVESKRIEGKVKQKVIQYFPSRKEAEEYAKKNGIPFPEDEDEWIDPPLRSRLDHKLKELNKLRPLPPETVARLLDKFEVDMTYHSNAIEGNRLTLRETWLVLRKGMTIRGKSVQEHLEATNHREAIEMLEKIASGKKKIEEMDVLNLHATILDKINPKNAGFYRRETVFIGGSDISLPNWKKVPELMQKVYGELNDTHKGVEAVYSAVKIHYDTARVHPFVDGNGRLARLLMNLRLMRAGFPPTILQKEQRRSYYSALEKADKGDMRPLAMLIGKDVEKALDFYLKTAKSNRIN